MKKTEERKEKISQGKKEAERKEKERIKIQEMDIKCSDNDNQIEMSGSDIDNECSDETFENTTVDKRYKVTTQNRIDLENLARESIQYGESVQATASLATALLIYVSMITKDDYTRIIDKKKVQ